MKDPAFLFYPNDYLGGTMGMSFEQKGAYIDLLMLQFNRGHMTEHMIRQVVGQLWDTLKDKFKQDENGNYFNERLEYEQNRRCNYTLTRRNNLKGNNQFKKDSTQTTSHMSNHMENENRIENINTDSSLKGGLGEKINFERVYNTGWMMSVYSILEGKLTPDQLTVKWSEFQKEMTARDDLYRTPEEYRRHFPSWVKFNLEKKHVNGEKQSGIQKPNYALLDLIK